MRTELREVIEEFYIADDGTEFNNEEDCLKYEFDKRVKGGLIFYDAAMDETDCIEDCAFVDLPTEECVKGFRYLLDSSYNFTGGLEEPGVYMWWDTEGQWLNLDWLINHIRRGAKDEN